jgi:hypothetical protein
MSLIQEALRRHNTETGQPEALLSPELPAPPPLPPPPPRPARRFGLLALLLVLLLALLGYGGWWFLLRAAPSAPAAKATAQPVAAAAAKAALAQLHTNLIAQAKAKLETTVTPERTELVLGVTNAPAQVPPPPAAVATNPLPDLVRTTHAQDAAINAPPPAAPAPKPLPVHVVWPKLNITGIMGRAGGAAVIFINGQILKVGEVIEGARIIGVQENGAQLVLEGETNFFRVGKSAE